MSITVYYRKLKQAFGGVPREGMGQKDSILTLPKSVLATKAAAIMRVSLTSKPLMTDSLAFAPAAASFLGGIFDEYEGYRI